MLGAGRLLHAYPIWPENTQLHDALGVTGSARLLQLRQALGHQGCNMAGERDLELCQGHQGVDQGLGWSIWHHLT
jgi:hypothetical protein